MAFDAFLKTRDAWDLFARMPTAELERLQVTHTTELALIARVLAQRAATVPGQVDAARAAERVAADGLKAGEDSGAS